MSNPTTTTTTTTTTATTIPGRRGGPRPAKAARSAAEAKIHASSRLGGRPLGISLCKGGPTGYGDDLTADWTKVDCPECQAAMAAPLIILSA